MMRHASSLSHLHVLVEVSSSSTDLEVYARLAQRPMVRKYVKVNQISDASCSCCGTILTRPCRTIILKATQARLPLHDKDAARTALHRNTSCTQRDYQQLPMQIFVALSIMRLDPQYLTTAGGRSPMHRTHSQHIPLCKGRLPKTLAQILLRCSWNRNLQSFLCPLLSKPPLQYSPNSKNSPTRLQRLPPKLLYRLMTAKQHFILPLITRMRNLQGKMPKPNLPSIREVARAGKVVEFRPVAMKRPQLLRWCCTRVLR